MDICILRVFLMRGRRFLLSFHREYWRICRLYPCVMPEIKRSFLYGSREIPFRTASWRISWMYPEDGRSASCRCRALFDHAWTKNRIDHENYQFLFVADVEYFIDQSYFDSLTAKMKVVVMANRDCDLQKSDRKFCLSIARCMYSRLQPFWMEKTSADAYDERWHHDRFRVKEPKFLQWMTVPWI